MDTPCRIVFKEDVDPWPPLTAKKGRRNLLANLTCVNQVSTYQAEDWYYLRQVQHRWW